MVGIRFCTPTQQNVLIWPLVVEPVAMTSRRADGLSCTSGHLLLSIQLFLDLFKLIIAVEFDLGAVYHDKRNYRLLIL